ncbi:UPF0182 family protein, partial [Hyella patelloides]|uniref:UPF0182 family protein n=1 Tax=Hyella patelloides TaxID=1982969 RepID=UPI001643AAB6
MKLLKNNRVKAIALLIVLGFISELSSQIIIDWLWFQEVNYLSVFIKQRQTQVILSVLVFSLSSLFF